MYSLCLPFYIPAIVCTSRRKNRATAKETATSILKWNGIVRTEWCKFFLFCGCKQSRYIFMLWNKKKKCHIKIDQDKLVYLLLSQLALDMSITSERLSQVTHPHTHRAKENDATHLTRNGKTLKTVEKKLVIGVYKSQWSGHIKNIFCQLFASRALGHFDLIVTFPFRYKRNVRFVCVCLLFDTESSDANLFCDKLQSQSNEAISNEKCSELCFN